MALLGLNQRETVHKHSCFRPGWKKKQDFPAGKKFAWWEKFENLWGGVINYYWIDNNKSDLEYVAGNIHT